MTRRVLALPVLLLLAACAATPPPVVVPQPAPRSPRTVQATIRGTLVPAATLLTDDGKRIECPLVALPDGVPRVVCTLHVDTPEGWGAHLTVSGPDRTPQTIDFALQLFSLDGPDQNLAEVVLAPSFVVLARLVPDGQFFRLATGEPFTVIAATDFNLLARDMRGEDIDQVLEQRAALGFNTLRVFTAFDVCATGNGCQPIGRLWPSEYPDYYAKVVAFLRKISRKGLRAELVAFTGRFPSGNADEMVAHWTALQAAVRDEANATFELQNEVDNAANAGVPFERMQRPPPPILASHGSAVQDTMPPAPFWGYVTYHSAEPRKVVHNGMSDIADPYDRPVVVNETVRVPDNNSSLANAEDTAAGCALLEAGCTFHSVHGKNSTLWSGAELALAKAWTAGARSVPLEFQRGHYVHRDDLEAACGCPRVYSKRLPDGREWIVRIRP